jgi:hypothetical protein
VCHAWLKFVIPGGASINPRYSLGGGEKASLEKNSSRILKIFPSYGKLRIKKELTKYNQKKHKVKIKR